MNLIFAARLRRLQITTSQQHAHKDLWQLEHCLSGPIEYRIDGNRHILTDGAVVAIPPGFAHHQRSPEASDSYLLKFRRGAHDRLIARPTSTILSGPERQLAERLFAAVIYEYDGRAKGRNRMIESLIDQTLVWVRRWSDMASADRPSSPAGAARERVRLVGDMLRRQYAQRFTVARLAQRACLSRSHFLEMFRSEFGTSPIAFHTRARMEKAVELARYTGLSWQQIAAQVGYDDPAYFSRTFRKAMGASPSKFTPAQ